MAASISVEFETATGDTESATQALGPLRWETGQVTLRRRAPHTFDFVIPRAGGAHRLADFVAGRELRVKKNDAHWQAGFMGAPSLVGGSQGGAITLPGWGNAYALMLVRNSPLIGFMGVSFGGFDTDGIITYLLDNCEHGSGGDWFPLAGRTLGSSATTFGGEHWLVGKSALEFINDLCDFEGWAWRAGISAAGAFTFAASATVEQDLTASVKLYDGGNCRIVDVRQDGSRITARVIVTSKYGTGQTRLAAATIAGATTLTVDSATGLGIGDALAVGVGGATEEFKTISNISGGTITLASGLVNAHGAEEVARLNLAGQYRGTSRQAAASVRQAHHGQQETIFDETLIDIVRREERGDSFLTVYDHVQRTATVETTDARLIDILLTSGCEPGDDIQLTSSDADLDDYYTATTVTVQELRYELAAGGVTRATLALGDPRADDLAALERQTAAGRNVAISVG